MGFMDNFIRQQAADTAAAKTGRRPADNGPAADVRRHYADRCKEIRADKTLSDDGRRAHLARAYLAAKRDMQQVLDKDSAARDKRHREAEEALFGFHDVVPWTVAHNDPAVAISRRDATDRAGALKTPTEALSLLARANASGDRILGKAVAAHAYEQGWTAVIDAYAQREPAFADKVAQLDQARGGGAGLFAESMAYSLPRPSELGHADEHAVAQMVAEQGDSAA